MLAGTIEIDDSEISFVTSRSGGPGGQNVNKVESRVTLLFDVAKSSVFTEEQRLRLLTALANRINRDGVLQVTSQKHRSQLFNKEETVAKFQALIAEALTDQAPRKKTRVSRAAKARRVEGKRKRSAIKRTRGSAGDEE